MLGTSWIKNPKKYLIFQFENFKKKQTKLNKKQTVVAQNNDLLQSCFQTFLLIYSPADFFCDGCPDATLQ